MSFNKKAHLQDNIKAITLAFQLERESRVATIQDKIILRNYVGFGGLKAVLNPAGKPDDISQWTKSEVDLYPFIEELHTVVRNNTPSEREYKAYFDSIKSSVLTSFYTPQSVVRAIADAMKRHEVVPGKILDPSAGVGVFQDSFGSLFSAAEFVNIEKDLITGLILKHCHRSENTTTLVSGFEQLAPSYNGHFDLVASNVPFGDFSLFDPRFMASKEKSKIESMKSIHNYFFVKGVDTLKEGGILAFITSQGVMDSPSNEPIRQWLMNNSNLVSAIRLPNNLFKESAGTEVGSDLIVLQKNTSKSELTSEEQAFVGTRQLSNGITINNYFKTNDKVVHTASGIATNQYGKPAILFEHDGGADGIAKDLLGILSDDFGVKYQPNLLTAVPQITIEPQVEFAPVEISTTLFSLPINEERKQTIIAETEPVLTLYDIFGMSKDERSQVNRPKRRGAVRDKKRKEFQSETKGDAPFQPSLKRDETTTQAPTIDPKIPRKWDGELIVGAKNGTLVSDGYNSIGYLRDFDSTPTFYPLELSKRDTQRAHLYIALRNDYLKLYEYETSSQTENAALRASLNRRYNRFVNELGNLNKTSNARFIKMDAFSFEVLALEKVEEDGNVVKSDIFSHPVSIKSDNIVDVDNVTEALAASLNQTGGVDLSYMSTLLNNKPKENIISELADKIHLNPVAGEYETSDRYLSGNVVEKLKNLNQWLSHNSSNSEIDKTLAALKASIPTPISYEELEFNFGERWIPVRVYEEFARHLFQTDVKIIYAPSSDEFAINVESRNALILQQYAVQASSRKFDGIALMKHAFHNTTPEITKSITLDGKEVKIRDGQAIQLANSKIDLIRSKFTDWLDIQSDDFRNRLTDLYNSSFNCFVRPTYDGSHLALEDLNLRNLGITHPYDFQKDAAWMVMQNGGGIIDHEVGLGKTLTMCIAAHEMKRLGLAQKIIIAGLKANTDEIASTYKKAYPNDKVLYAGKDDLSPSKRKHFFNLIKNNDWDAIILTHDQFGKIPQSPEIQNQILSEELNSLEENLEILKSQGKDVSRGMLRGLQKRKENLSAKLHELQYTINSRKDDVVDFKTMGIDHLFVDESQFFKNLMFTTRHDRVAGLGNSDGSQRASNLLFAIRTIQERTGKDLGATFLSGTTIANSLTELYLLFKYLRPQALEKQNIRCFDAWAAIFAQKTIDFEFSVTNEIVQKERFRYFIKVPELASFYNEITDYRTGDVVGIDRPQENVIFHDLTPSEDQEIFIDKLILFARHRDATVLGRPPLTPKEEKAIGLLTTDLAQKMSLDMRLLGEEYSDHPMNKLSVCAQQVADNYYKFNEQNGTQFVFSDLGVYKPEKEWDVYRELKQKLVEDHNLPPHEVRFIQEAKTDKEKKQLIEMMREGKIRVLMGSSQKLGTGVNAQKHAVAAHILVIPWRPDQIKQMTGRAVRQGNYVAKHFADNKVDINIYGTKKSLDAYKFNLLQNKQLFIDQLKNNNLSVRRIDEGAIDSETGMNMAEYVAILSGNTELLEKAKIDKKIAALESERSTFYRDKSATKSRLESLIEASKTKIQLVGRLEKDLHNFKNNVQYDKEGVAVNLLQIKGVNSSDAKVIGTALNGIKNDARTFGNEEIIGSLYGFNIVVKSHRYLSDGVETYVNEFGVKGEGNILYTHNNGRIAQDPILACENFIKALEKLPGLVEKHTKELDDLHSDTQMLAKTDSGEWLRENDLKALKSEQIVLDKKILQSITSKEENTQESEPLTADPKPNIRRSVASKVS